MAVIAMFDSYIGLGGADRSAFVHSVTLHTEAAELDATSFASGGWNTSAAGRKMGSLAIGFNQDVAAAAIDSVMWPLSPMGGGTGLIAFEIRATAAVVGASNPKWTGTILLKEWTPLDGAVGDLAKMSLTFPTSGPVVRAIA